MNNVTKIFVLLTFLLSCQTHYRADEIVEYLPLNSPKNFKVLKDTTFGDGECQNFEILVEREYYNRTREMIEQHDNFKNLGSTEDSLWSYSRTGIQPQAYYFDRAYFFLEQEENSPRLNEKFLHFGIVLSEDSIIYITSRPL